MGTEPKALLCLGASIVRGDVSDDWVAALRRAHPAQGLNFVNCGRNGDMALGVDRRLDAILQRHPQPLGAVLLVGTNDVLATHGPAWRWLEGRANRLDPSVHPTVELYVAHVDSILRKLSTAAPSCRVAVLSLPPLGEDLGSELNAKVRRYNAALRDAVRHASAPGFGFARPPQFLDLHAAMEDELLRQPPGAGGVPAALAQLWRRLTARWEEALGFSPALILLETILAQLLHAVLRQPWTVASDILGLRLLTDHIHLNERSGGMVVRLVSAFLEQALR